MFGTVLEQTQMRMGRLRSSSTRIMVGLWVFSIFIITVGYRGGLMSVLTVPLQPNTIDTISELAAYPLPVSR